MQRAHHASKLHRRCRCAEAQKGVLHIFYKGLGFVYHSMYVRGEEDSRLGLVSDVHDPWLCQVAACCPSSFAAPHGFRSTVGTHTKIGVAILSGKNGYTQDQCQKIKKSRKYFISIVLCTPRKHFNLDPDPFSSVAKHCEYVLT